MVGVEKWFLLIILYLAVFNIGFAFSAKNIRENALEEGLCPPPREYSSIQYFTKGCDEQCGREGNPAVTCYTFCGRVIFPEERII